MTLHFRIHTKLKTRKIVYEDIYLALDPGTLEQEKELTSRRRLVEEATNETRFITKAIAKEMSGGLTSRHEQDLRKLEQYLPLLENFIFHVHLVKDTSKVAIWTSNLRIRWTSALSASPVVNILGPKFYRIDDLQFELGMTLFLYGAILRERASEVLLTDLVESATVYRKAAGVYDYLAHMVLPLLQPTLGQERPPEVVSSISSIMSLICLAEAQAVTLRKAEEKGSSEGLLSKLHYGIKELFDEACKILELSTGGCKNISQRFQEFIHSSRSLHELRSQKHLAQSLKVDGQIGMAIGVVRNALHKVKKKIPGEESWKLVFKKEMEIMGEMLRKLEHENNFVCYEKIPCPDDLPTIVGVKLVKPIPYQPQKWERKLVFKTEELSS